MFPCTSFRLLFALCNEQLVPLFCTLLYSWLYLMEQVNDRWWLLCFVDLTLDDLKFSMQVVGTLYTHHQKTIIVDSPGPQQRRVLTSFLGGLDLTGGRWDTPTHLIFASLQNEHKNDFRQKSWEVSLL